MADTIQCYKMSLFANNCDDVRNTNAFTSAKMNTARSEHRRRYSYLLIFL